MRTVRTHSGPASTLHETGRPTWLRATLSPPAQILLMVISFIGRVGTVTAASAFALRTRKRYYHLPQERPIVG